MSGIDIPARSARAQIASAINVVIQVARLSDGSYRSHTVDVVVTLGACIEGEG